MLGQVNHALVATKGTSSDGAITRKDNWNAAHALLLSKSQKTADYQIVIGDRGSIIELTGSTNRTFTLPKAADVPTGWFCFTRNKMSTGIGKYTVQREGTTSDTIDGGTSIVGYRDEFRLIRKSASGIFLSTLLRGGFVEVEYADSPFVFTPPTGASMFMFEAWGGGGAGAGGAKIATAGTSTGVRNNAGCGGYAILNTPASRLGSADVTITIAAGATGVAGSTTDSTGPAIATPPGGTTTISITDGELLRASPGQSASGTASGGGGSVFAAANPNAAPFVSASQTTTNLPGLAGYNTPLAGRQGATSPLIQTGPIANPGLNGGGHPDGVNLTGTGGAGAAGSDVANGGDAADQNTVPTGIGPGLGGGAGGATSANGFRGGHGGNGGVASGGGAGGACLNTGTAGGDGGDGGPGLARIYYFP